MSDPAPLEPRRKRVDVTLVIHTTETVPEDWDDDAIRFYVEENHCLGNYLRDMVGEEEAEARRLKLPEGAGICNVCAVAEAYVGHLPFPPHTGGD